MSLRKPKSANLVTHSKSKYGIHVILIYMLCSVEIKKWIMFLLKDYLLPDPSFRNLAYRWFRNQNEAIAAKKTSQQKDLSRYKNNNIYIYISIYIYMWWLIKIPLSANCHSSRNFRELHLYLSRGPCWATTPLMKIRSPLAKLRQRITDHFLIDSLFKHAASITESLLRTDCCWAVFFARFSDPPPSTCTLTFARSFAELSGNFRENIPSHRPRPSAGGALKEKRTPGALVFGSREASPLEAGLLLMKGKVILQKRHHTGNWTRTKPKFSGALLLPDPRRGLHIMIQLSRRARRQNGRLAGRWCWCGCVRVGFCVCRR